MAAIIHVVREAAASNRVLTREQMRAIIMDIGYTLPAMDKQMIGDIRMAFLVLPTTPDTADLSLSIRDLLLAYENRMAWDQHRSWFAKAKRWITGRHTITEHRNALRKFKRGH